MSISRSLVVGIDREENRRRDAGHYWRATVRRGDRPTAVIEKPKPKNRRSVRTIALSAPAALLVAELRVQHVARAETCGVTMPLNSFVLAADVDGSRPIRPESLEVLKSCSPDAAMRIGSMFPARSPYLATWSSTRRVAGSSTQSRRRRTVTGRMTRPYSDCS